jgi:hypothetical protein
VKEGLKSVSSRFKRLPLVLASFLIHYLTRREMNLSADWPIALPYLKAAVAVSKRNRRAVLYHIKHVGKESF